MVVFDMSVNCMYVASYNSQVPMYIYTLYIVGFVGGDIYSIDGVCKSSTWNRDFLLAMWNFWNTQLF